MNVKPYRAAIEDAERAALHVLRALEHAQQTILFNHVGTAQRALHEAAGDLLSRVITELDSLTPPRSFDATHHAFKRSLVRLETALSAFCANRSWPEFATAFMLSRGEQCKALETLYGLRDNLPLLEPYFRLPDAAPPMADATHDTGLGVAHHASGSAHNEYSLYVPEYYDAGKDWPLIVCLHGGHGRGDEYLWSWLRAARSRGYILLSPKSIGPTWSIMQPSIDIDSINAMIDSVVGHYAIDSARTYLTGLSDGATFSFLLGLEHAERFAGVAPIAGVLSPTADFMLRGKQGIDLPIHVIHGAHDMIFPVETARSTSELLRSLGYRITYTELPDWGHALTYAINTDLVLPWIERLESAAKAKT